MSWYPKRRPWSNEANGQLQNQDTVPCECFFWSPRLLMGLVTFVKSFPASDSWLKLSFSRRIHVMSPVPLQPMVFRWCHPFAKEGVQRPQFWCSLCGGSHVSWTSRRESGWIHCQCQECPGQKKWHTDTLAVWKRRFQHCLHHLSVQVQRPNEIQTVPRCYLLPKNTLPASLNVKQNKVFCKRQSFTWPFSSD